MTGATELRDGRFMAPQKWLLRSSKPEDPTRRQVLAKAEQVLPIRATLKIDIGPKTFNRFALLLKFVAFCVRDFFFTFTFNKLNRDQFRDRYASQRSLMRCLGYDVIQGTSESEK